MLQVWVLEGWGLGLTLPLPTSICRNLFQLQLPKPMRIGIIFANAPTCYRAPRRPNPELPRKIPNKKKAGPKFWTPGFAPKLPRKYRKNTPKIYQYTYFWYFFGGVFSWGSRISARFFFFRHFSWNFQVGLSRGSVAGREVLKIILLDVKFKGVLFSPLIVEVGSTVPLQHPLTPEPLPS